MVADFSHLEDSDYYQDKENKPNPKTFAPKKTNSRKISQSNCLREITAKCLKSSTNKKISKTNDNFGFSGLTPSRLFEPMFHKNGS
jgi:hypothetical protein